MSNNINPTVMFPNAVIILKGMQVSLKGAVYSDAERINDQSTLTFLKPNMHLHLNFGQIDYLIIKIPNENRYNVTYENKVYSVLPDDEQLYTKINNLFMNAKC